MPSGGKVLALILVVVIACSSISSLIGYQLLSTTKDQPCSSCAKQPVIKPLGHLIYHVREDSKQELVAVTRNWQRWAEFAPCRSSSSPTNWESGQVALTIVMSSPDFAINELLAEAWRNLADRVRWCFLEPQVKIVPDIADLSQVVPTKSRTFLLADADFWPVTENWLNMMSLQAGHMAKYGAMGHVLDDGTMLPQAIYNADRRASMEGGVMAINSMIGALNGSVQEYRRHNPDAVFVIARDGAIFDDF